MFFKGFMFIITFIITDCGIVFAIHIGSYVYQSPMGYAFYYFITCMVFSIADWGFSLKRFVSKQIYIYMEKFFI